MIDVGRAQHLEAGSENLPLIGHRLITPASHWPLSYNPGLLLVKCDNICFGTWLNPLNVRSCNYTSKRNWQELISARAIINRLEAHFLAPVDNGELGLIFHELIMIGMWVILDNIEETMKTSEHTRRVTSWNKRAVMRQVILLVML